MKLATINMLALSLALSLPVAGSAVAQTSVEGRVVKLEKEMKAVQRKVFPGGASPYFEAENTTARPATATGGSASPPVTDLIGRVDALEAQLARITGQVEEQGNRLRKVEGRLAVLEVPMATTVAPNPATATTTSPTVTPAAAASASAIATVPADAKPPAVNPTAAKPAAKPAVASNARIAAVAAIEKPTDGDAGENAYNYGYRLWEAKFYPEAQVQLADMVKKHPRHKRISHARNLLGRAWLDDGKPATSTQIFLDNYQADPRGERAPESLYFLGAALTKLKKNKEACQAFDELAAVYPDVAGGRLASRVTGGRTAAACK